MARARSLTPSIWLATLNSSDGTGREWGVVRSHVLCQFGDADGVGHNRSCIKLAERLLDEAVGTLN